MDAFIQTLKEKEKELVRQLEDLPVFKQLEILRVTIRSFQPINTTSKEIIALAADNKETGQYDDQAMTWKQKILFALGNIREGFVLDIVQELRRLGNTDTDEFLIKRISVMASNMKNEHILNGKAYGKKIKYSIK